MDERTYCLTPEQWRHAKACLTLAKHWGLIGDDSPEALHAFIRSQDGVWRDLVELSGARLD